MTSFLNDVEKNSLRMQIAELERGSEAEIVTVIASESDTYRFIPLLWAALLSLCVPGVYLLGLEFSLSDWSNGDTESASNNVYVVQVLIFLLAALLFQFGPIQMALIPNSVKFRRAHRLALAQFIEQRVHWTDNRTGILLFVSVAEHYVEIVADKAIAEKVDNSEWQEIVNRFIAAVKQDKVANGFNQAVSDCAALVATHFPMQPGNKPPNQLRDTLIELDHFE